MIGEGQNRSRDRWHQLGLSVRRGREAGPACRRRRPDGPRVPGASDGDSTVHGTLALSQELGEIVRDVRAAHGDPIARLAHRLGGVGLFTGKVGDVARRTEGGFARLEARIDGLVDHAGSTLTVRSQNEHLLAELDGEVVASTPDLIIVFDTDSGEPITTETIRYGYRVSVVGAPCDERWRSDAGLALVGPRYFGYDADYMPVEQRPRS